MDGLTSTNPIAVGDRVSIEPEDAEEHIATIVSVLPRKNYVARVSPRNKRLMHILASNLDRALLVASLKDPKTSTGFIDRFLTACETQHIPATVLFNKTDLHGKKETEAFEEIRSTYTDLGYEVLECNKFDTSSLEAVREKLAGQTTLIGGHSGVGKSTLLNFLLPEQNVRTQEVSGWSGKGMHTTTFAEMFDLLPNGKLIDTPGIRELGLTDVTAQELGGYFPEMRRLMDGCKFNDCLHVNETDCAVKRAVESGEVHWKRYASYLAIMDSL